jgi:branched-chain amino acid transport system permease protein
VAAAAAAVAAVAGILVGLPSLRLRGDYLAIATLAGQLIIEWTINHVTWISGGVQASIEVPRPELFGFVIDTRVEMYYFLLFFVVLAVVATMNLVRSRIGRAFIAIRDHDIAAEIIGVRPLRTKLQAFGISSFYCGVAGAELLFLYYGSVETYAFDVSLSFLVLFMVIIGGLGSIGGCFVGAVMVGLVANYVGYLSPKIALGSNILLMVMVLLWRPQGLYPVSKQ